MPRKIALIAFILLIAGTVWWQFSRLQTPTTNPQTETLTTASNTNIQSDNDTKTESNDIIRITAVGDMLPHDTINLRAKTTTSYDYSPFFTEIDHYFANSDMTFCNQEAPSAGRRFSVTGYPVFNAPAEFSRDLQKLGCDLINLANNHIGDKGIAGIEETLDVWEELGAKALSGANRSQAEQNSVQYFDVKGHTFALLAFTDLSNNTEVPAYSINMFSEGLVKKLVGEAANNADYVIVSAHWGLEYSQEVSASQRQWAQVLADNGADLIIGTGPHVLQTVDELRQPDEKPTIVFYSLGNLLSTQLELNQLIGGIAIIELPANLKGKPQLSFVPTYMHYEWTAEEASTENLLARKNLKLYPLSAASDPLRRSLFSTTVASELNKISRLLNQNVSIKIVD